MEAEQQELGALIPRVLAKLIQKRRLAEMLSLQRALLDNQEVQWLCEGSQHLQ